jgi:hypothetical protein
VFDGILVDVFYEVLNGRFWDVDFVEFSYGVFMYVSSYSNCNDNEGVYLCSLFCSVLISGHIYSIFV